MATDEMRHSFDAHVRVPSLSEFSSKAIYGRVIEIEVSSHQYATPLAATSGVDDTVNFSSPSALLALGGYTLRTDGMRHSFDAHVRVPSLSEFSSKAIYGRVIEIH
jgi:hypothetical protein